VAQFFITRMKNGRLLWALASLVSVLVALPGSPAAASSRAIVADLGLVSVGANVQQAHVNETIEFTAVAEDFGPRSMANDSLDVKVFNPVAFEILSQECSGGISPDTPFCEFGEVAVGQQVSVRITGRVLARQGDYASVSFCVSDESGYLNDRNPANNCATVRVPIVGSH
jgi:Domain of unknown function DUF11